MALFLMATQFLTRVPVRSGSEFQARSLSESLRYFPLVGGLVGLIEVSVWWLSGHWFGRTIAVGLMLAASLLLTGALHEDGFADTCDGFGGGNTRERVLAIMKDSRIGAFGAIGLIVLMGLKWSALVALPGDAFWLIVVASHVVSRWCTIGLVRVMPYARAQGEGKSGAFDGGLPGGRWILSGALGLGAAAIPVILPSASDRAGLAAAAGAAFIAAACAALLGAAYLQRRLGGYTGDCLGAVQQVCELAFLLGALAVLRPAMSPS